MWHLLSDINYTFKIDLNYILESLYWPLYKEAIERN